MKKTATKKPAAKKATPKKPAAKKLGQLEAAAKVLATAKEPMTCKAMVEAMSSKGLWSSPGGKTPAATLSAAIAREIASKGAEARFKKTGPGHFAKA